VGVGVENPITEYRPDESEGVSNRIVGVGVAPHKFSDRNQEINVPLSHQTNFCASLGDIVTII